MEKQKTLIFLLSVMLFLAASFIVYSWNEPTTPMPSGYTAPLNTSATAQNKVGELGAASFVDADDSDYYINPSGNSVIAGNITTVGNIVAARATESDQVTTKGYIDEQIALVRAIVSGAQPIVNGAHTQKECSDAGGQVTESDVAYPLCKFIGATCPSGWTMYKHYGATQPTTCTPSRIECGCQIVTTGSHAFSNFYNEYCAIGNYCNSQPKIWSDVEIANYADWNCCGSVNTNKLCLAVKIEIGCY